MNTRSAVFLGNLLALNLMISMAYGDIITTTVEATFDAGLTSLGLTNVTNQEFDTTAAGTLIANGSSLGGITFGGLPVGAGVDDDFVTTSGLNYLGIVPGGTFTAASFTFSFAPTNAFSMKIITSNKPPTLSNDDFTLSAGGQSVNLNVADSTLVFGFPPFSSESYFFGIINTDASFTSATFTLNGTDTLNFFIDDLQIAGVPEPSVAVLVGLMLLAIPFRRGRMVRRGDRRK
jgi:hypothetical protein